MQELISLIGFWVFGFMKLYIGVTPDKYELPLFVADSLKELSKMSGIDYDSIRHRISKNSSGRNKGIRFIKIIVDEVKD